MNIYNKHVCLNYNKKENVWPLFPSIILPSSSFGIRAMAASNSQASETHSPGINIHPSGVSTFHSTTSSLQLIRPMSKIVTAKLEDGNLLTWKQQVLIAIRGYGFEGFITKDSIPSQFIVGELVHKSIILNL